MEIKSKPSSSLTWSILFNLIFKIFGHLFIILAIFWLITLGRPIPFDLTRFVIFSTLLGYLGIIVTIQVALLTLKRGKDWRRFALVAAYVTIGLLQVLYILKFINTVWIDRETSLVDDVTNTLLIITAVSGLISSIAGILSQITMRKKMLAEIDIEKQKLDLEREKVQMEKEKLEKLRINKPE